MAQTAKQFAQMLAQGDKQYDDNGNVVVDLATCYTLPI